jgi:hypothetical protein
VQNVDRTIVEAEQQPWWMDEDNDEQGEVRIERGGSGEKDIGIN